MDEAPLLRLLAAIHFPGDEEALLVGFRTPAPGPWRDLPKGRGFVVGEVAGLADGYGNWFSLTRAPTASRDLFATMAEDILGLMTEARTLPEPRLVRQFLGRIRAWQNFMSRDETERLGPERELGLVGELAVYDALLTAGLPPAVVNHAWRGPLDGLHDFVFGDAAIEVKTTLAADGFPARISSLEQLDGTFADPLWVAAVRACLQTTGSTLSARVTAVHERLQPDPVAAAAFDRLIRHAGYSSDHSADYDRRFSIISIKLVVMDETVPRLQRTLIPPIVRSAAYELDLDLIAATPKPLLDVLSQLGFSQS
jgi:hypothetical protein